MKRLRTLHIPPREFKTEEQLGQSAARTKRWLQSDEGKKSHAKSQAKWAQSDEGKESNVKSSLKWAQSDKGKKTIAKSSLKWRQSDEGKKAIAKRAQSDAGKKTIAKSSLQWRQSDEGEKTIAKSQAKIKERKHIERQELIVQQTASLRASSSGTADDRLCVARGDVLAATLAADGGSGGRSSLCFRQHEGMIDHTKPGGVKDLALNVLGTHHDDQHVEALAKEANGLTGSPRMSSSVLQPMADDEVVDALLCPAHQRAPVTVHQSQIEAASRLVAAGTALPVGVNV